MKLDEVEGFGVLEDLRECDEFSDLVLGFVIFSVMSLLGLGIYTSA
jgi:hypothetical protein